METSYVSFLLPDKTWAYISAETGFAPVLQILSNAHKMKSGPDGKPLLHLAYTPENKIFMDYQQQNDGSFRVSYNKLPPDSTRLASAARNTMFLSLLPMLKEGEIYLFHGGLTVDNDGFGAIFCGPSGVGKSTAVAKAGKIWEILADDLMYLSFQNGKLFAQPGPTWSSYLFGKERLAECDINRIVEVRNIIILSRVGEFGIHQLPRQQAGLMLANSFIEMITWHSEMALHDKTLSAQLKRVAFDGVMKAVSTQNIHLLTSCVDTDITPFLKQITV